MKYRHAVSRGTLFLLLAFISGLLTLVVPSFHADEGMWTFNHPPVKLIQERYGFKPGSAWLDHLRLSCVRIGGASGSFVSPNGLILTNHHVARMYLQELSTAKHNYVKTGFYAKNPARELKVPGAVIQVLISMQNVTKEVTASVSARLTPAKARKARDAVIAKIENVCRKKTGLTGEVVALYGGARYVLYRYKQYTDVRIVMAPEQRAAYFGGDTDNFCYPRYDLDFSFLRVYEHNRPAHTPDFLRTNRAGIHDNMPIFVSGNPASTDRIETLGQLKYARDATLPYLIGRLKDVRDMLQRYAARGPAETRESQSILFYVNNSIKALTGEYNGLLNPALIKEKKAREEKLHSSIAARPSLRHYAQAWKEIDRSLAWNRSHAGELNYESMLPGYSWGLAGTALSIARYAEEVKKPDAQRLEGYHEAQIPNLLRRLEAPRPYYKELETVWLAHDLALLKKHLGADDPYVRTLLAGKTPEARAKEVMDATRLNNAAFRKKLLANRGALAAVSQDSLLRFVRAADPTLRRVLKARRKNITAVREQALTKIAKARFAVYGNDIYPDATDTLRLSFGVVKGYPFDTSEVPCKTTFYGLYNRAYSFDNKGNFQLSKRELQRKDDLDLSVPLDFVCTADITGGNSGSPVVDGKGELVGLVFDGNPQSNSNTFVYSEVQARCVAVDVTAIIQALDKLYDAGPLAREMITGTLPVSPKALR